jgi:hypothetical protein
MSALVLKSWKIGTKPIDTKGNFVSIQGRESGLIAWFLSLLGVDPVTTIEVGLERIEFTSSSIAGTESRLIPLPGICSTYYGYYKPWKAAASIFLFFIFIGGSISSENHSVSAFFVSLIIGLVFSIIYYNYNRTLTLGFVEHSGIINGIRFKRSVIENVDVTQEQAKQVCALIQKLIEVKEKRARESSSPAS